MTGITAGLSTAAVGLDNTVKRRTALTALPLEVLEHRTLGHGSGLRHARIVEDYRIVCLSGWALSVQVAQSHAA
jgi:hypothetical protein